MILTLNIPDDLVDEAISAGLENALSKDIEDYTDCGIQGVYAGTPIQKFVETEMEKRDIRGILASAVSESMQSFLSNVVQRETFVLLRNLVCEQISKSRREGHTLPLIFIVNGENIPVEAVPTELLYKARNRALELSHNTGRPYDEWEVYNERGERIRPINSLTPEDLRLPAHTRLFASLRVGVGADI